jgi:hypothetical protein
MWDDDEDRYATVKAAEITLLSSPVRHSEERVRALLHPQFAEIGRSGRRWTYQDTIEALSNEETRGAPEASEWLFNELAPSLVLVNYRVHNPERDSRHSSI